MTIPEPNAAAQMCGILFVLSGPSGVGKDTVLQRAMPQLPRLRTSISVTTRSPRRGEQHGVDYFFVSDEEFRRLRDAGELLEFAEVHGYCYGTPRQWVLEELRSGIDVVLEIDVQGAEQVKAAYPEAVLVFLAPPHWDELARRLRARKTEDESTIRRRLRAARHELERIGMYDYLIINDHLSEATDRLHAVVMAERSRPARQDISALLREEFNDA